MNAFVYLLFLASGATALIYQVTWFRNLSLVFGASFEATSIVLAAFMAGLSAGGFAFARMRVGKIQRALRVYGVLELGVAGFALTVPVLLAALDGFYVRVASAHDEVTAGLNLLRVVLALAILFVPTFLMGGTLPVLISGLVRSHGEFGSRLAWLYGVNTLGAVAGALGAGFLLIPSLGVSRTQLVAVVANVVIALLAFAVARRPAPARPTDAPAPAEDSLPAGGEPRDAAERRALWLAYWGTALGGFCALALEVMWARAISLAVGATTYSFTVMLAAFLAGIWIGSWIHAVLPLRRLGPALQLGLVLCATGVASALASMWIPRLPELAIQANLELYGMAPRIRAGTTLLLAFLVMLPPCVFMGIAFPLAGEARARLTAGFGRPAGEVLGLNTLGAIAGALAAGFLLIPLLGLQRGMLLAAGLYFAYGCLLLVAASAAVAPGRRFAVRAAAAAGVALALIAVRFVPTWDIGLLGAFQNDHLRFFEDEDGRANVAERVAAWTVLYYREGRSSTVSVVDQGWHRALIVNGKAEASDDFIDRHLQILIGHVPLLIHPDPRSAFVLGMGTGITLGAVTAHPGLEQIVLAEIEPAVLEAAPYFSSVNYDPLHDPRLRVEVQDGRNYLKTTTKRFDVITADPIHPWTGGSVYLYTTEYYRIARERLTPNGVMCQWLPLTGLSEDDVRTVMATFAEVFPHVTLWQASHDVLLIGGNEPLVLDLPALRARIAEPSVRRQLAVFGIDDAIAFLAELGMDDQAVREYASGAVLNTDDNVHLEFSSPLAIGDIEVRQITQRVNRGRSALGASRGAVYSGFGAEELALLLRTRGAKSQVVLAQVVPEGALERLRRTVALTPDYRPARIALARALAQQADVALAEGRADLALARSREALRAAEDEPMAHLVQGAVLAGMGRHGEAVLAIERAIALDPDRWISHFQLGLALLDAGHGGEAAAAFERALVLNPGRVEVVAYAEAARTAAGAAAGS